MTTLEQLDAEFDRIQQANRDLLSSLAKLVAFLDKHGGYMSAVHQRALREAKALLKEHEQGAGNVQPARAGELVEGGGM